MICKMDWLCVLCRVYRQNPSILARSASKLPLTAILGCESVRLQTESPLQRHFFSRITIRKVGISLLGVSHATRQTYLNHYGPGLSGADVLQRIGSTYDRGRR